MYLLHIPAVPPSSSPSIPTLQITVFFLKRPPPPSPSPQTKWDSGTTQFESTYAFGPFPSIIQYETGAAH